jgi:hypothetical protein
MLECSFEQLSDLSDGQNINLDSFDRCEIIATYRDLFEIAEVVAIAKEGSEGAQHVVTA